MSGIVNSTGAVSGVIGTTVGTPAAGINSPWEHIASWGTNVDLSGTYYINFQGVFTEEYTTYKVIIPYLNSTSAGGSDDLWFRFMSGDIASTSKAIAVENSTTGHVTASNYRWMTQVDGSDNGTFERTNLNGIDDTKCAIFDNFQVSDHSNSGCRGEIDIYNPHKTKLWNYAGTPAQLAITRGDLYGPSIVYTLAGYNQTTAAEATTCTGTAYYNTQDDDDFFTGFSLWTGLNADVGKNTMLHLLGLKLDLSTS